MKLFHSAIILSLSQHDPNFSRYGSNRKHSTAAGRGKARRCRIRQPPLSHILYAYQLQENAKVIEEGLATAFSEDILEMWFGDQNKAAYTSDSRYRDAALHVRQLLQLEPDAIRSLRRVEPAFSSMTAATFDHAGLGTVPQPLIAELLRIF